MSESRRFALIGAAAAVAMLAVAVLVVTVHRGGSGYRVDAIFDDAGFLIAGNEVKVAGAEVGTVTGVSLTRGNRARVEMTIDPRFAFRSNADCTIQLQSLIGEKFVQCTPGTPSAPALRGSPPTLPVTHTHSPVDVDLVLSTFDQPVRQRLSLIVGELGAGVAGRGDGLNAALRRADPALGETRAVLSVLNGQRAQLSALVHESSHILGTLATRRGEVGRFIENARAVLDTTAGHGGELQQTVHDAPALLAAARPALGRLGELARSGTPVVNELGAAAPSLERLTGTLSPFSVSARPALARLAGTAAAGSATVDAANPLLAPLRSVSGQLVPVSSLVSDLFTSLRQNGVPEGLDRFVYYATAAEARYDRSSHLLTSYLVPTNCTVWATKPTAGCDAHFALHPAGSKPAPRSAPSPGITQLLDYLLR